MKSKAIFALAIVVTLALASVAFAIDDPSITVTVINPNGNECDDGYGNPYSCSYYGDILINWTSSHLSNSSVRANISYWQFGSGMPVSIIDSTENDGQYLWDTTGLCGAYIIGITLQSITGTIGGTDWSDNWFNVTTGCEQPQPPVCNGTVKLKLSPNPALKGSDISAYVYGLTSGCTGKLGIIRYKNPIHGSFVAQCSITASGACTAYFTAPLRHGNYHYFAVVDKNNDGHYRDKKGEIGKDDLKVLR